jgi:hypothetical protein
MVAMAAAGMYIQVVSSCVFCSAVVNLINRLTANQCMKNCNWHLDIPDAIVVFLPPLYQPLCGAKSGGTKYSWTLKAASYCSVFDVCIAQHTSAC